MNNNIFMSIIVPVHNEQLRIRESVTKIIRFCEKYFSSGYEILLIENGSTDETFEIAHELHKTYQRVYVRQIADRSKAVAVRHGMTMARGKYRYMCDCDLSTPIDELRHFLKEIQNGWDVVIGSREMINSHVETNFKRWFIGRMFNGIVSGLTGLDYKDTQCGFKLFTARAAQDIFSHAKCASLAFDVEALYLALQLGYYVTEMPVTWINDPDSRVRILSDSWRMLQDVRGIKKLHGRVVPAYKQKNIPA